MEGMSYFVGWEIEIEIEKGERGGESRACQKRDKQGRHIQKTILQ